MQGNVIKSTHWQNGTIGKHYREMPNCQSKYHNHKIREAGIK